MSSTAERTKLYEDQNNINISVTSIVDTFLFGCFHIFSEEICYPNFKNSFRIFFKNKGEKKKIILSGIITLYRHTLKIVLTISNFKAKSFYLNDVNYTLQVTDV